MNLQQITSGIWLCKGSVNNLIVVHEKECLLVDCCDKLNEQVLGKLGVSRVDTVILTGGDRIHGAGLGIWVNKEAKIAVSEKGRDLLEYPNKYFTDDENRWHIYKSMPFTQWLQETVPVNKTLSEGQIIKWHNYNLYVMETPGICPEGISLIIEHEGVRIGFCGELIVSGGKLKELYSLQKGHGPVMDYHGFLGNKDILLDSLKKLCAKGIDKLIPSYGEVITEPEKQVDILKNKLERLYINYSSISSINFYIPGYLPKPSVSASDTLVPSKQIPFPFFVEFLFGTSHLIKSRTGACILVDCGNEQVVEELEKKIKSKNLKQPDYCWVTHYHDDHTDALDVLEKKFPSCQIITSGKVFDLIRNPNKYFLPCQSPVKCGAKGLPDGYSWSWEEFTLTSYDYPGQTLYHGALLVEGSGRRILFAGDSLTPHGIDDYCPYNRVFHGEGRGFDSCMLLLEKLQPDAVILQHQQKAFTFSRRQIDVIRKTLAKRFVLLRDIIEWEHPDFGMDPSWIRTEPYKQKISPGNNCSISLIITNHAEKTSFYEIECVIPGNWEIPESFARNLECKHKKKSIKIFSQSDGFVCFDIDVPLSALPGTYLISFRIYYNRVYLGPFKHALITVK